MSESKGGKTGPSGVRYPRRFLVHENDRGLELLRAIAERWHTTPAEAIRRLIRDAAREMQVEPNDSEPTQAARAGEVSRTRAETAASPEAAVTVERQRLAAERLRLLVERARAGAALSPEDVQREVAILRAGVTREPTRAMDPERREYLMRLAEGVRSGVPEEWSEEELLRQVQAVVDEVREKRLASHG